MCYVASTRSIVGKRAKWILLSWSYKYMEVTENKEQTEKSLMVVIDAMREMYRYIEKFKWGT